MTVTTIIIHNAPCQSDNKAWPALRFAGAALGEDMHVRVHLLDEGVRLGRRGRRQSGRIDWRTHRMRTGTACLRHGRRRLRDARSRSIAGY